MLAAITSTGDSEPFAGQRRQRQVYATAGHLAARAVLEFKTHSRFHVAVPFKGSCRLSSPNHLENGPQPFENRYDIRSQCGDDFRPAFDSLAGLIAGADGLPQGVHCAAQREPPRLLGIDFAKRVWRRCEPGDAGFWRFEIYRQDLWDWLGGIL
jgi:hypothetical protein